MSLRYDSLMRIPWQTSINRCPFQRTSFSGGTTAINRFSLASWVVGLDNRIASSAVAVASFEELPLLTTMPLIAELVMVDGHK